MTLRRVLPWALCLFGFTAFFAALFAQVWATGGTLASGDALVQTGVACYGPHARWSSGFFAGYPLFADPTQMRYYPLSALCPLPGALEILIAAPFPLAAFGMCGFVRTLTKSWLAGIVAGFAFALGGFMIAHEGHVSITTAAAWSPFMLWALESLRRNPSNRSAFAGLAATVALCMLAGQPQTPLFVITLSAAYALACALSHPNAGTYLRNSALAAVLGIGLSAIQLIPEYELFGNSTRLAIGYDLFVSDALSFGDVVARFAFPFAQGDSGSWLYRLSAADFGAFTDAANSSGLALLLAACAGALAQSGPRRWFWILIVAFGAVLSLGPALGTSLVTYRLPVYSLFRHPGLHAFEIGFGVAVLSGYGVAALERRSLGVAAAWRAIALTASLALVAWLAFAHGGPHGADAVAKLDNAPLPDHLNPLQNLALGLPLLGWLACACALAVAVYRPRARAPRAAFAILFVLSALVFAEGAYWNWFAPPRDAFASTPLARAVAAVLAPAHGRLLASQSAAGTALEPNLTALWSIPTLSAYLPLVPRHLREALDLSQFSSATPATFAASNASIVDMLGARLIAVNETQVREERTSDDPFSATDLGVFLGGRDAAPQQSASFEVGPAFRATSVEMLDALGFSTNVPQGVPVGRVIVTDVRGRSVAFPIRAGIETAEAAFDRPDVRGRVQHRSAQVASAGGGYRRYRSSLVLPQAFVPARVEIERTYSDPQHAALSVDALSIVDTRTRRALALGKVSYLAASPDHWRRRTFEGNVFYENLRATPAAWIPVNAAFAPDDAALAAMRAMRAGRAAFDPRVDAFVAGRDATERAAHGTVELVRLQAEDREFRADCATACLLIDNEMWYPGWNVAVDGRTVPLVRADVVLRGARVPAGRHDVRFRYQPQSGTLGMAVSCFFGLSLLIFTWKPRKPASKPADRNAVERVTRVPRTSQSARRPGSR